ncbi:MAG TPA: family 1 encapsulin nanocompartment shell protein [Candidatus Hypogeohydataceae bacterium YC41]
MIPLKKFQGLTVLFVLPLLFYLLQGATYSFANGAEPNEMTCPQQACKCNQNMTKAEASSATEGNQCASITSEVCLKNEDWEKLQRAVHETVEKHLVGRKFLDVYGPLGAGTQCVPLDTYDVPSRGGIDMLGEGNQAVHPLKRDIAHIPLIYKDFWLFYRDIEATKKSETPLDLSAATGAAVAAARSEDDLIFNGSAEMGMAGLLNVNGRNVLKLSDWSIIGNGFQDVVTAVEKLISLGFNGPFALVVSPRLYAYLNRVYERTGQLEIRGVQELVKGGVFQSYLFKKDVALAVALGRQNLDLAVGTDFKVEYWGPANLNHRFRVVGTSVLRIKSPQAICTLE